MKTAVVCKICGKEIGVLHGYKIPAEMHSHIKAHHPEEYKELVDIRNTVNVLANRAKNKYGIGLSFLQYYKSNKE